MSHPERGGFRRITSIPPRTSIDVLRGGVTIRFGGASLVRGTRGGLREPTAGEQDWNQIVAKHTFQKPPKRERTRSTPPYEEDRRIKWQTEVIEDYNGQGDLGIILQFDGIELTKAPFLRSRHNRPDSPVFYIPIDYNQRTVRLFLATKGDIFESQIAPIQMDVNPFFQEELYLPQLTTTHSLSSMTVFQNNQLVIVGFMIKL